MSVYDEENHLQHAERYSIKHFGNQEEILNRINLELQRQERIAPRSSTNKKNNHYIPQFFLKKWSTDNSKLVYAMFAKIPGEIKPVSVSGIMASKFLYTVPEISNPNIFENIRSQTERYISKVINMAKLNNYQMSSEDSALLISLMLCGSPAMMHNYYNVAQSHLQNYPIEESLVRALASSMMITITKSLSATLAKEYNFKTIQTFEPMILSDYPVIQLLNGKLLDPLLGIYPATDQIFLPINPYFYLEATRKTSKALVLGKLRGSSINDFMVKTAQNLIIGDSELSITAAVIKYSKDEPFSTLLPANPPWLSIEANLVNLFGFTNTNEFRLYSIPQISKAVPTIYADNNLHFD